MFDTIGHTNDPGRTGRAASAVVLLASVSGGLVATSLVVGAWLASGVQPVQQPDPWDIEEYAEPALVQVELPDTPPPPAAAIARGEEAATDAESEPQPDEMVPPVDNLDEPVDDAVAEAAPMVGDPDGIDGGDPDGDADGRLGGVLNGTGDTIGALAAGPRTVHHSQVRLRVSQTPEYPDAALDMNLGRVDCRVNVLISESGRPLDSSFASCPAVFHANVIDAVSRMRWAPYRINGQKSTARFTINFVFEPR